MQVLSETVSNAFKYFDDPTTRETQRFISYFDRVFDCLNVRSLSEWQRKKKLNLKPYTSKEDERLDVSTLGDFFQLHSTVTIFTSGWNLTSSSILMTGKSIAKVRWVYRRKRRIR